MGVVDFYCHKAGLVAEVDGDIHDLQWEKALRELGLRIVRFKNDEVVRELSPTLSSWDAAQSAVVGR